MPKLTIRQRLGGGIAGFIAIICGMFVATWIISSSQINDGLVINLAGRQRMLIQKMTKEILYYHYNRELTGMGDSDLSSHVQNSMALFQKTLLALKDSGNAPVTLNASEGDTRYCPVPDEDVRTILSDVITIQNKYFNRVNSILDNKEGAEEKLDWIMQNNLGFLSKMNEAVTLMQKISENKTGLLLRTQAAGIAVGICFAVLMGISVISTIKRLNNIKQLSLNIGSGDFTAKSNITGHDELGDIGKSLDSMISNLKGLFKNVLQGGEQLNNLSSNLSSTSFKMNENSEESASVSVTVAAAAEEMSANMTSVAAAVEETATNVAEGSMVSKEVAREMAGLSESSGEMNEISIQVKDNAGMILTLSENVNSLMSKFKV